jgi:DNA polymerase III delta prime subunit
MSLLRKNDEISESIYDIIHNTNDNSKIIDNIDNYLKDIGIKKYTINKEYYCGCEYITVEYYTNNKMDICIEPLTR